MRVISAPIDAKLPRLRLTVREFMELGEYSCTLPTGTTIGKRWRRLDGSFDAQFKAAGGQPRWIVGEFHDIGLKDRVGIRWFKPVIIVQAHTKPVAQCSGCGHLTADRRAVTCCSGHCLDASGKSCNAWPCPKCGKLHYWTCGFKAEAA